MKKIYLLLILLIFTPVYAIVSPFTDVDSSDWFYNQVTLLKEAAIISGYGDGTFRPENQISVEEFITLTIKVIQENPLEVDTKHWSDGFVEKALQMNIIQENEFVRLDREINRGEIARIVLRAKDVIVPDNYQEYGTQITDLNEMDNYWQNIAMRVYVSGLISGYPDGSFKLDETATRAEAVAILIKLYDSKYLTPPKL